MQITPKPGVIWNYCKAEDISRDELARRVGVNRATAYRIDEGMVQPSTKFIAGFITVTGRRFEDLFEIVGDAA